MKPYCFLVQHPAGRHLVGAYATFRSAACLPHPWQPICPVAFGKSGHYHEPQQLQAEPVVKSRDSNKLTLPRVEDTHDIPTRVLTRRDDLLPFHTL